MSYIGNQPGYGKPEVFVVTASGGETSVSTADDGRSINYAVGYVSVYLNGVLLVDGTDYTATSGSSISGLSALTSGDVVTVVSFETFAIPDAVSEQDGGAFLGDVTVPNLLVGDGGNVGSASDPDAMSIASGGVVTFSQGIALAAGKGIDFNAVQSTASGTTPSATAVLDDYEEGTFTVTLHDQLAGGNTSATTSTGNYTKVGNVVHVQVGLQNISSAGMTSANPIYFRGFPFTPNGSIVNASAYYNNVTFPGSEIDLIVEFGFSSIAGGYFTVIGSGLGNDTIKWSGISSGVSDFTFSGFYYTS